MEEANVLLLLGLLHRQSMHGYELHEFLENRLQFVSNLKKSTAYRILDRLYNEGLVERAVEREGRRPERLVYHLTHSGRKRFEQLLREELARADQMTYSSNVAVLFCDHVPPAERTELLARRRATVEAQHAKVAAACAAHSPGTPPRWVLEHDLAHLEAELAWLDRAIGSV